MKKKLTLGEYVKRRNGVGMNQKGALKNMLMRSLGAGAFAQFWQYWNPVFGYYLATKVFSPCKRFLPSWAALIVTFTTCGAIHDSVSMLVRVDVALFFTPWFFFMGTAVVITRGVHLDYSRCLWALRAFINLSIVLLCMLPALWIKV